MSNLLIVFNATNPEVTFIDMAGQFSELERKPIEPIAFVIEGVIEGGQVRAMQRFVSEAPWDEEKIMIKYRNIVKDDLGHPSGAFIFDETGFVKKGKDSIGVSKQYCGTKLKVNNWGKKHQLLRCRSLGYC